MPAAAFLYAEAAGWVSSFLPLPPTRAVSPASAMVPMGVRAAVSNVCLRSPQLGPSGEQSCGSGRGNPFPGLRWPTGQPGARLCGEAGSGWLCSYSTTWCQALSCQQCHPYTPAPVLQAQYCDAPGCLRKESLSGCHLSEATHTDPRRAVSHMVGLGSKVCLLPGTWEPCADTPHLPGIRAGPQWPPTGSTFSSLSVPMFSSWRV